MALRGNLKDFSLPDVFQLVTFSKKTGVLRIRRADGAEGSVWFREGEVFFAQSNWHGELLGHRLVAAQRITPQALHRALEMKASEPEGGRRLGQILVDEGYITDTVLESFVQEQIQDTIFDLMRWDEGDFDFELLPEVVDEDIGLSLSIENIVMEGSRRLEEWNRIKKKIPSMDIVFKMATAPGEGTFEISLKPVEWNLLLLVDGTRSVGDLAVATRRTDFEVARIIYGLFSAGLLEFATDEEVERLRAERIEREAKLAQIEAEQRAAETAQTEAAQAREAALEAEAEARRAAAAAPTPSEPAAAPVTPSVPQATEVPEFLGGPTVAPTADDVSVFEEMVGAVLHAPEPPAPAPAPGQPPAEAKVAQEPETPAFLEPDVVAEVEQQPVAELVEPEAITEPAVEAVAPQVEEMEPPAADFERDLMALGLGELPETAQVSAETTSETPAPVAPAEFELPAEPMSARESEAEPSPFADLGLGLIGGEEAVAELESLAAPSVDVVPPMVPVAPVEDVPVAPAFEEPAAPPVPEPEVEFEVPAEPMSEHPPEAPVEPMSEHLVETPAVELEETPDFGALMESLDEGIVEEAPVEPAPIDDLEAELSRDAAPSGGVISTDAYLADITIDDLGLSGGLTDEISALTGAERRPRPQASVNRIPEPGQATLHRDSRIDRETLMKIIDGVERL